MALCPAISSVRPKATRASCCQLGQVAQLRAVFLGGFFVNNKRGVAWFDPFQGDRRDFAGAEDLLGIEDFS